MLYGIDDVPLYGIDDVPLYGIDDGITLGADTALGADNALGEEFDPIIPLQSNLNKFKINRNIINYWRIIVSYRLS